MLTLTVIVKGVAPFWNAGVRGCQLGFAGDAVHEGHVLRFTVETPLKQVVATRARELNCSNLMRALLKIVVIVLRLHRATGDEGDQKKSKPCAAHVCLLNACIDKRTIIFIITGLGKHFVLGISLWSAIPAVGAPRRASQRASSIGPWVLDRPITALPAQMRRRCRSGDDRECVSS
jgi:hypothetical protein